MALGKRLISTGVADAACLTDSTDPFGDSSGVALYSLDYDASTAPDGTDYSGTPTNVEFGVGGQINYGARFNGSSSYIDLGNSLMNNYESNNFSFSCWFNLPSTVISSNPNIANNPINLSQNCIFTKADYISGAGLYGFIYGIENGEFAIAQGTSSYDGYSAKTSGASLSADTWHHVVITKTSSNVYNIYIDGSLQTLSVSSAANGTFTTNANSRNAYIMHMAAATYGDPARYTEGSIDQVRIFSSALDSTQVTQLYNETACVYTCTTDTVDFPTTNVAYYKLDNNATDETGSYDGTETNVSYEFGRFGQAAVFNGSSSYIDTGISGATLGELFSVSVWFKTSTTSTFQTIFDNGGNTSGSTGFAIIIGTDNILKATFTNSGGGGGVDVFSLSTGATVTDGNWHHCVLTYNDESAKIYLDNNTPSTGTNTEPFTQAANALRIGAYYASGTSLNFNGDLDQIRVFTSELDSTQVTQLYEEKQCFDTVTEPTGNLRFDEFWAGYDDGQTNRAEFKSSGQIVDFNTNSEGHAVLNQNAQTSGKYYLEIQLVSTSGHDGFGVFNRSTNTVYDDSPYAAKNPIDSNYGATLYARGSIMYLGNVSQSGFTNLSLGNGDIVCMAVNVDEKRIWWGRRDGLSDNEIVWSNGNPNGGYGGLEVSFVPSDVIVTHVSESVSRYSEFKVLNHADMLEPPFNFSYLDGAFTASLTENEANF
jgi:hypothetical protein